MRHKELAAFIAARERHRTGKGKRDPVIAKYRFCNVRRNDDRVTKWVHHHYFNSWQDNPDLWFALMVARLFNNPDTLGPVAIMRAVLPFRPEVMRGILQRRVASGLKNFNAAYIVSTNGIAKDKVEYLIDDVLIPAWARRKEISGKIANCGQLANVHIELCSLKGMGSFMAAQVIADLKYAHPTKWVDFHTFAASGPGSKRGFNRVMGAPLKYPWKEEEFRRLLLALRDLVNKELSMEPLTAQDLQNCLCEFDKYERARTGEGAPKQIYTPHRD